MSKIGSVMIWWRMRREKIVAGLVLGMASMAVYGPGLGGEFTFDDWHTIHQNPSIRWLTRLPEVLWPPRELPTSGRPLANLSFAINYAIHGLSPYGYHAVNVLIHALNAFLLFLVVRWTLWLWKYRPEGMRDSDSAGASERLPAREWEAGESAREDSNRWTMWGFGLPLLTALLWAVHPLNSEAVQYVTQRTELMMGTFYLLTLYAAIRAWTSRLPAQFWWQMAAVGACVAGMLTKEAMAAAPILVLLYDRIFVSRSYRQALRRSWLMYAGLAATWLILAAIVASGPRSRSVGFGKGITAWSYLKAQAISLCWYFWLVVWPSGQRILYYWIRPPTLSEAAAPGLLVLALLGVTGWKLIQARPSGLVGAVVFGVLAPSSSFVPIITEVTAERRMYLPLAAICAWVVVGGYRLLESLAGQWEQVERRWMMRGAAGVVFVAVVVLAGACVRRVLILSDRLSHWQEAVAREPWSPFAFNNYSVALQLAGKPELSLGAAWRATELRPMAKAALNVSRACEQLGRAEEALAAAMWAVRLEPGDSAAWNQLGLLFLKAQRLDEAATAFARAVEKDPRSAPAQANLAITLSDLGGHAVAEPYARQAVEFQPENARFWHILGVILLRQERYASAARALEKSAKRGSEDPLTYAQLGFCQVKLGRADRAAQAYQRAVELAPDNPAMHLDLAGALALTRRLEEAQQAYRRALELDPTSTKAAMGLANVLAGLGRWEEALGVLDRLLEQQPEYMPARLKHADTLAAADRLEEAVVAYRAVLAKNDCLAEAHNHLGIALARLGRLNEAAGHFRRAVELDPALEDARYNLQQALARLKEEGQLPVAPSLP